jgi:hypothetical protein
MRLADNGKASSGKGTRHINIRYFSITDRIARKEIAIQYCPTKEMVPDYFTKPPTILQIPRPDYGVGPHGNYRGGPQECVG